MRYLNERTTTFFMDNHEKLATCSINFIFNVATCNAILQDCLYARTSGLTVKGGCVTPFPPGPAYFLFKFCYAASSTIPLGIITCIITDQSQSLLHHHLQIIIITIIGMIVVIRKSVSLLFTIIRS